MCDEIVPFNHMKKGYCRFLNPKYTLELNRLYTPDLSKVRARVTCVRGTRQLLNDHQLIIY